MQVPDLPFDSACWSSSAEIEPFLSLSILQNNKVVNVIQQAINLKQMKYNLLLKLCCYSNMITAQCHFSQLSLISLNGESFQ